MHNVCFTMFLTFPLSLSLSFLFIPKYLPCSLMGGRIASARIFSSMLQEKEQVGWNEDFLSLQLA